MNSKTKIIVFHIKELIIAAAILIAIVILIIIIASSKSQSTPSEKKTAKTSGQVTASMDTYVPGVYTSSLTLNGVPLDVKVTVDANNINSIELENLSESIETMYPMLSQNFSTLSEQVKKSGSTQTVIYDADEKYTAVVLLDAIDEALNKAK